MRTNIKEGLVHSGRPGLFKCMRILSLDGVVDWARLFAHHESQLALEEEDFWIQTFHGEYLSLVEVWLVTRWKFGVW